MKYERESNNQCCNYGVSMFMYCTCTDKIKLCRNLGNHGKISLQMKSYTIHLNTVYITFVTTVPKAHELVGAVTCHNSIYKCTYTYMYLYM